MQKPNIVSSLVDEERNAKLEVYAYKPLTKRELLLTYAQWKKSTNKKLLPKNKIVTVHTTIGFNGDDFPII